MNIAEKIYEQVKSLSEPAVMEVLDFVEFIKMRQKREGTGQSVRRAERLRYMSNARGLWKDRKDLPDFQAIRHEWDRAAGEGA